MSITHHSSISAEIRRLANSCDLGGMNKEFFLKATFIDDIATYVQRMEQAAFDRGISSSK